MILNPYAQWVTAAVKCAPPANKPTPEERDRCQPFLQAELEVLSPFDAVYERVAARATTTDLTARVVRRQPAQAWSRRHDATVDT